MKILSKFLRNAVILLGLCSAAPWQTGAAAESAQEKKKREANDIAVTMVVSGLSCTCARFAEDIRNVVNDLRPDGIRVMPVLGVGGLQNANDVLFLRNIDMGVVDEDNLRLLKKRNPVLYSNIERQIQYIAKLYNSEFHVLARSDIKTYEDLRGKNVNFGPKDSQTEVTADVIFSELKLDVQKLNLDNDEAIKRLRDGHISAMIVLSGAPQTGLAKVNKEDHLHFLSLDQASLPGRDLSQIFSSYLPAELTHEHYPNLIAEGEQVSTVANRALLVSYAWPEGSARYQLLSKFVHEFFGKIDQFQNPARHPKWKEINLAAEIPGWVRFKPAADWLAAHQGASASQEEKPAETPPELKAAFEKFMQGYATASDKKALDANERSELFARFLTYLDEQKRLRRSSR